MLGILKKYRSIIIVVAVFLAIIILIIGFNKLYIYSLGRPEVPKYLFGKYSQEECDLLTPEYGTQFLDNIEFERTIDFADAKKVTHRGYGFKKRVSFTDDTVFHMELIESMSMYRKGFVYGIYEDSLLKKPIAENHLKIAFDCDMADEMGINIPYKYGVDVILQPGTYYIGMFGKQVDRKGMEESFVTNYSYIKDTYELKEDEQYSYYNRYKEGAVYFKLTASKTGRIRVVAQEKAIQLCDESKKTLTDAIEPNDKGKVKGIFEVEQGRVYYIKQEWSEAVSSDHEDEIYPSNIKFCYVK